MTSNTTGQRHILIIPSWYFDHEAEGIFIHEHARMLSGEDQRVGLIYIRRAALWKRPDTTYYTEDHIDIAIRQSYYLPRLPGISWIWKWQYLQLYREYVKRYGRPDLIHAHGYVAGFVARYIADRTAVPYVITEHASSIPAGTVPWHHRHELRGAYAQAFALIAVSGFLKTAMEKWLDVKKEISVIGNPVDFRKYSVRSSIAESNIINLISIGALERRKNYQIFLHALKQVHQQYNIRSVIVGTGPELEELTQLTAQLDLADVVKFPGYLSSQDLIALIQEMDFFVSTSDIENFGVAIVEALACGIPVIATRSGGPEEYLDQRSGRLVPVNDAIALSSSILDAISHRGDFNPVDIRNDSRDKFDFPVIRQLVDAVYQEVLKARANGQ